MTNAIQIRKKLAGWLNGRLRVQEFEDWFVPATWDIHKSGDAEAESLADEIELHLSEYTDGVINLQELKERLSVLASAASPFASSDEPLRPYAVTKKL